MASRFIEYSNSSENVSKIFFSSSFMMLGRGEIEGDTALFYLPTAAPIPLYTLTNFFHKLRGPV